MKHCLLKACLLLATTLMSALSHGQDLTKQQGLNYGPNDRYEAEVVRFETRDQANPAPQGAIVFIGSSSMGYWNSTVAEDMAPLNVIPRGFGGSNMNDALHYVDRLVLGYKPRAVVVYEGDNDIAQKVGPARIAATFDKFVAKVHASLPDCRIYVLSIKPSIGRWSHWPAMQATNQLLNARAEKNRLVTYVDVATPMFGSDGKPRRELFKDDLIHMQRAGYVVWRDALKPVLLTNELKYQ